MSNPNKDAVDFTNLIKDKFAMRKDIAPVETSSSASRAYKVGEQFYYGNLLQRATQDIAQGTGLAGGINFENADPVTTTIQNLSNQAAGLLDNGKVNGAVNMLPYDLAAIKANNITGTWSNNVYTLNNVQWTFADDGTVTAVTTGVVPTHSTVAFYIDKTGNSNLIGKTLRLTGCPSNGGGGIAEVQVYYPVIPNVVARDYGSGTNFLWNNDASTSTKATVNMVVRTGTASGKTFVFKPMLSVPSLDLKYNDHVSYAKSNKELTEDVTTNTESLTEIRSRFPRIEAYGNVIETNKSVTFTWQRDILCALLVIARTGQSLYGISNNGVYPYVSSTGITVTLTDLKHLTVANTNSTCTALLIVYS